MQAYTHLAARIVSNASFTHDGDTTFSLTLLPLTAYCPDQAVADKLTQGVSFCLLISTGQCRNTTDRARIANIQEGNMMTFELEAAALQDEFIQIESLVSVKPMFPRQ